MARINLEDISPGMVLGGDAKDRNGRILLGAGTVLTEKHLKIFKMWGVTDADIKGVDVEEVAALTASRFDPVLFKGAEEQIRDRFCHVDMEHPFNKELCRLLVIRLARRESGRDEA